MHIPVQIPEHLHRIQRQTFFYIPAAFLKRHAPLQHPDAPDAFLSPVNLPGHIQHPGIPKSQDALRETCHSQHIIIGMHGVVGNVALDQFQNPAAYKIAVGDAFQRRKDQRMMGDQHVRLTVLRRLNHLFGGVQRQIDPLHFLIAPSGLQSHIVKTQRRFLRIHRLDDLHDLFTLHNASVLSGYTPVLLPVPSCAL